MSQENLALYLNDHLAGSVGALGLFDGSAASCSSAPPAAASCIALRFVRA